MEPDQDDVRVLVEEALHTGLMLTDVMAGLLENMPDDAFPGQEPGEVLLQMVVGSMRPVADAAGADAVKQTIALLGAIRDRFVADLHEAMELARGQQ